MAKCNLYNYRRFILFLVVLVSLVILYLWFSQNKTETLEIAMAPRLTSLFTLNIWFGDYKMNERMSAIGRTMLEQKPDIITFQEVTSKSLSLLQSQEWFGLYHMVPDKMPNNQGYFVIILSKFPVVKWTSLPFKNSRMRRNLLIAELKARKPDLQEDKSVAGDKESKRKDDRYVYFTIATSHLESMAYTTEERESQLQQSLTILSKYDDVCLMGDLNIELKVDGEVQLPTRWFDAWLSRPGNSHFNGYTWDPKINTNAQVSEPDTTKDRFDRVFCKLLNFSVEDMSIVGTKPNNGVFLSDHFGVFTKLSYGVGTVGIPPTSVEKAKFMRPKGWEKFKHSN